MSTEGEDRPCLAKRCLTLDKPLNAGYDIEDVPCLSIPEESISFCWTLDTPAELQVGVAGEGTIFV